MATKKKTANKAPTNSGRFIDLDEDKLRGGYYTSSAVADWVCAWAIRSPKDRVLEPSCGDGAFLEAAAKRFAELGTRSAAIARQLTGVEIIATEADQARTRLFDVLSQRADDVVNTSDFFSWWQSTDQPAFDVVIGNPPFIRYQTFPEPHRSLAMALMAEQGLSPNRLTNIWVPFVVAAVASLRPGGRLALVLPAELLQVTYASQLRSFLTDRFESIDIVACNELFFEKAEQEVVLLLADGALAAASDDNLCRVTMTETRTVGEITQRAPAIVLADAQPKTIRHDNEKWLKYFLSEREITFMRALRDSGITANLSAHASVDVGVVTGKNEFFVLTSAQVEELGLDGFTSPLVSRSAHLKGARVGKADWNAMSAAGDRVHLLHLKRGDAKPTAALAKYIRFGEVNEVHKGYKCSIREPWYAVPSVWTPDHVSDRTRLTKGHEFAHRVRPPQLVGMRGELWRRTTQQVKHFAKPHSLTATVNRCPSNASSRRTVFAARGIGLPCSSLRSSPARRLSRYCATSSAVTAASEYLPKNSINGTERLCSPFCVRGRLVGVTSAR